MTRYFSIVVISVLFLSACSEPSSEGNGDTSANTVFRNGRIYTVNADHPWVEAVAVKDGKFVAVGSNAEIESWIGTETETLDLQGKMAMPGIIDAHIHLYGGIKDLFYCNFPVSSTLQQIGSRLQQCLADNPSQQFILGGYWVSSFFDDLDIASPRDWLDAISSDVAIVLSDDSGHNVWVNSQALQEAGISRNSENPESGVIVRDAQGEPNGLLYETSAQQVEEFFYRKWSPEKVEQGMLHTLATINQFGITAAKDAWTQESQMQALLHIDKNKGLTAHIATSIFTQYGARHTPLNYDNYSEMAQKYRSTNLYTDFIKFFLDGVPTSSRSAAMLAPYIADEKHPEDLNNRGMLHLNADFLATDLIEMDKRGFTAKIHAAGDRSVRVALDALELVRKANGDSGLMHEIAHAGFISDEDLPRFQQLNVAVDISPYLWFPSPIIDNIISVIGDRGNYYWPNRDALSEGATIIAGSDWPSVSPTPSPWPGIEATVSRRNPYRQSAEQYWPEQKLSLEETLAIFTLENAKALRLSDKTGSITIGKYADMIVLQDNLFDIPVDNISDTLVLQTWFKGEKVWQK